MPRIANPVSPVRLWIAPPGLALHFSDYLVASFVDADLIMGARVRERVTSWHNQSLHVKPCPMESIERKCEYPDCRQELSVDAGFDLK